MDKMIARLSYHKMNTAAWSVSSIQVNIKSIDFGIIGGQQCTLDESIFCPVFFEKIDNKGPLKITYISKLPSFKRSKLTIVTFDLNNSKTVM